MRERRWYGWGYLDTAYTLDERPGAWPYLKDALALVDDMRFPPINLSALRLRASRLDEHVLSALRECVGAEQVSTDDHVRLKHSLGKSYRDLLNLRMGTIPNPTDAVVFPNDADEVVTLLKLAANLQLAVVPFGGGTSVVGGVEPMGERATITLSLARLNRVLAIDALSQTVNAQAGIVGPELERQLNARGFTLGHFPQSFEFSTLGGWIATRSSGHTSGKYGKISDMVVSLRVVTPVGILETRNVPSTAAGPSILQLLVGSEGTLGVIVNATIRIWPLPRVVRQRGFLFNSFHDGVEAVRVILQQGLKPALVRLSDECETRTFFAMREAAHGQKALAETIGLRLIARTGHSFESGAALILGFEGADGLVYHEWSRAKAICKSLGAFDLGSGLAQSWYRDRYRTPYLRDTLMDHAILVDTLETATEWANVEILHAKLREAIIQATTGAQALVLAHLSHVYRDGASLYITFLARIARGREHEQWRNLKRAATECIMQNGGTLSHHHGVGYEHAHWLAQEDSQIGLRSLQAVKHTLDPQGILNPAKLLS